eukprot:9682706-Alexandrium_andersonii.AAC.1
MHPGRSQSQLAGQAEWPSPRTGICRNSQPDFPEAGAEGAALRAAPPALGSAFLGAPSFCRFRAAERAVWPVGRAGTATSWAGLWGSDQF